MQDLNITSAPEVMTAEKALEVLDTYDVSDGNEDKEFVATILFAKNMIAKSIIKPCEIVEDVDEDEEGRSYDVTYYVCPTCRKTYRILAPAYCERCGQHLSEKEVAICH